MNEETKTAEETEIKQIAKIEMPQADFEIMRRESELYRLGSVRDSANARIRQLEAELANLTK